MMNSTTNNNNNNNNNNIEEGQENDSPQYQEGAQGAVRFPAWVALSVLSVLSCIALASRKRYVAHHYKWVITVAVLSSIFSLISVVGYIFQRGIFMTQPPELATSAIVLLVWAAGLPVIMNPGNGIAVSYTQVENANLYFASWLSFFCILWICGNLVKEIYGFDWVATVKPMAKSKQGLWYTLVATSVIVMSASVRILRADQCSSDAMSRAPICKQTKFAIFAGVLGTVTSAGMTFRLANGQLGMGQEFVGAVLMIIIWCFGMGIITFGEGPGHSIGNLYFATWGSFVLSIFITAECYKERLGLYEQQTQEAAESATSDLQVEDLPNDLNLEDVGDYK